MCDTRGPSTIVDDSWVGPCQRMTGVVFQRSEIRSAHVRDGATNTYLIGEKFLPVDMYTSGRHWSDNASIYTGSAHDIHRYATRLYPPTQDTDGGGSLSFGLQLFGSAHSGTWQAVFCDGSVHSLSYFIDPEIHHNLGNRKDGEVIDLSGL